MVFIKPYDEEVFENFFVMIKYIQAQEEADEEGDSINVIIPPDLNERFCQAKKYRLKYNIDKSLETYSTLTEEFK